MTLFATTHTLRSLFLLIGLMLGTMGALASSAKKEESSATPGAVYKNLYPPFVVSFKGEKHLRFLRVDITLRLQSSAAEEQISTHMPRIRNDLIILLSSQPEASLITREGKEKVRTDALKVIQDIISKEEGSQGVIDLLFMNFVVQD